MSQIFNNNKKRKWKAGVVLENAAGMKKKLQIYNSWINRAEMRFPPPGIASHPSFARLLLLLSLSTSAAPLVARSALESARNVKRAPACAHAFVCVCVRRDGGRLCYRGLFRVSNNELLRGQTGRNEHAAHVCSGLFSAGQTCSGKRFSVYSRLLEHAVTRTTQVRSNELKRERERAVLCFF